MPVYLFLNHRKQESYSIGESVNSVNGITYEVGDRIDSGGNAVVHRCVDSGNANEYAIKFNLSFQTNRIKRFQQEIAVLENVEHDQIIKCIDKGSVIGTHSKRTTRRQEILFMIMPIAESNLLEYVKQRGVGLAYSEYIGQLRGICSALSELHTRAIHRDIKPENILVIGDTWYLSDLGLCKYTAGCEPDISIENEVIGPRYWMSPGGGPYCLDSLMGGISSEFIVKFFMKHQAASANG